MFLLQELDDATIQRWLDKGSLEVLGHQLDSNDIRVMYSFKGQSNDARKFDAQSSGEVILFYIQ